MNQIRECLCSVPLNTFTNVLTKCYSYLQRKIRMTANFETPIVSWYSSLGCDQKKGVCDHAVTKDVGVGVTLLPYVTTDMIALAQSRGTQRSERWDITTPFLEVSDLSVLYVIWKDKSKKKQCNLNVNSLVKKFHHQKIQIINLCAILTGCHFVCGKCLLI